jgi:sterol desaturase/sphingolipid hydroxylase (fatty acid hydroxylase superfamily)
MMWSGPTLWVGIALSIVLATGLAIGIEEWRKQRQDADARRDIALSLSCLIPNTICAIALTAFWTVIYASIQRLTALSIPTTPLSILLALVAVDFCYYWEHRTAHRTPWLWRLYHATHHSSDRYNVPVAYRVSFANHFIAPLFYAPCALAGFEPLLIASLQLLVIHYQAWVHTELIGTLGWLDRIFNTPANHRIHHSTAPAHQHRNFGAILMIWDRLFRTYHSPECVAAYGISGASAPRTWLALYLDPWRRSPSTKSSPLPPPPP